jgi:hypothetical protein
MEMNVTQCRGTRYWWLIAFLLAGLFGGAEAQSPFVPSNADVAFTVRTDQRQYEIGEDIPVHYTIKNISNGPIYVPKGQWDIRCGDPPHLWGLLEDSKGKHYEPGYGGSCGGPSPVEKMSISERMLKDAVLLKPGQSVSGSYDVGVKVFSSLKPGKYRLEAILWGWNIPYSDAQIVELRTMKAPFLMGESNAVVVIELTEPKKP